MAKRKQATESGVNKSKKWKRERKAKEKLLGWKNDKNGRIKIKKDKIHGVSEEKGNKSEFRVRKGTEKERRRKGSETEHNKKGRKEEGGGNIWKQT